MLQRRRAVSPSTGPEAKKRRAAPPSAGTRARRSLRFAMDSEWSDDDYREEKGNGEGGGGGEGGHGDAPRSSPGDDDIQIINEAPRNAESSAALFDSTNEGGLSASTVHAQEVTPLRQIAPPACATPQKHAEALTATPNKQDTPGRPTNNKRTMATLIDTSPRKRIKRREKEITQKMASFIFFDLETTNIFKGESYEDKSGLTTPYKISDRLHRYTIETPRSAYPHMTEASFVVVNRKELEAAMTRMKCKANGEDPIAMEAHSHCMDLRTPVVANVHTRQLRPQLTDAEWYEYENSRNPTKFRLNRAALSDKASFKQEWPGIRHLLETVPKPACIVAHNGLGFDMRVLNGELERAGMLAAGAPEWMPEGVVFVDSLLAFREIDAANGRRLAEFVEEFSPRDQPAPLARSLAVGNIPATVDEEDVVAETPEELIPRPISRPPPLYMSITDLAARVPSAAPSAPNLMKTPERRPPTVGTASAPAKLASSRALFPEVSIDPSHPLNYMRSENWTVARRKRVQGHAFVKSHTGRWKYDLTKVKPQFGQENMFKSIFGDSFSYEAHQAQADCEALLQVRVGVSGLR